MKYLLLLALFSLCANLADGQYTLGLNLEKGNTYFLKINAITHFDGEMDGRKMAISSAMTGITRFKVAKVSELEYELEANYDSLHLTMITPMGRMEFSSGNSAQDSDLVSGPLNRITSKRFNVTLLKNGAVRKIENPDTAGFSAMFRGFPLAEGIKMLLMGPFKKSFSSGAMKENMEKLTAIFPNKKVKLNESWGSVIRPDSGADNSIKTSYQLVGYQSGVATIKGHSESKTSNTQKQGSRFPAIYDLEWGSESTIQVNAATGWIKEAAIKNELKGHVQLKPPFHKQGKADPIQMNADIKISSY